MYPKTKEERKKYGVQWEITSGYPAYDKNTAEFKIFDKSGQVRSRLMLDKEDLEQLRHAIDKALGANGG